MDLLCTESWCVKFIEVVYSSLYKHHVSVTSARLSKGMDRPPPDPVLYGANVNTTSTGIGVLTLRTKSWAVLSYSSIIQHGYLYNTFTTLLVIYIDTQSYCSDNYINTHSAQTIIINTVLNHSAQTIPSTLLTHTAVAPFPWNLISVSRHLWSIQVVALFQFTGCAGAPPAPREFPSQLSTSSPDSLHISVCDGCTSLRSSHIIIHIGGSTVVFLRI